MSIFLASTDALQVISDAAATLDILASWSDLKVDGSGDPAFGRTPTAMTTATTTTVVAAPAATWIRNVKELTIRNKHATLPTNVTIIIDVSATDYEIYKANLAAGEMLEYIEGIGWFEPSALISPVRPNFSVAAQTPTAATLTQLAGSSIAVPSGKLRIGTILRWEFDITKTAAGVATSAYHVRVGVNNTTADAAILTFTKPLGTAVIDKGIINIRAIVRGPLSASCIMAGTFNMRHNLVSTGHNTTRADATPEISIVVSSGFDATVANLFVSLSCTTGAADVITTQCMIAEALNLW